MYIPLFFPLSPTLTSYLPSPQYFLFHLTPHQLYLLVKDPEGKTVFQTKSGDVRDYRSALSSQPGTQAEESIKAMTTSSSDRNGSEN